MLTHPNIKIPQRGQIYSVNDARYFDCELVHSCASYPHTGGQLLLLLTVSLAMGELPQTVSGVHRLAQHCNRTHCSRVGLARLIGPTAHLTPS